MDLKVIDHATCTFCGCVCDDIQLHADDVRIHQAKKACVLGKAWFLNHTAERKYPDALIDGKEATVDEAIAAAAEHLYQAILQSQPFHSDANHNLGVLLVSMNRADEALPLFKVALNANPKVEQFKVL